jgi:hypothetical protein
VYSDSLIENNIIHDVGRRSICLYNYALVDVTNVTVQNNTLYNGFHTTGVDIAAGSEDRPSGNIDNIIVRNNLMYDDPYKELEGGYGDGTLWSELNFISGTPPYGNVTGIYFYNNIFMYPSGAALHFENVDESFVYNNVFYGKNKYRTSNNFHLQYDTNSKNITIKNNIFYGESNYSVNPSGNIAYFSCGVNYGGINYSDVDTNNNLYYQEDDRLRLIQLAPGGWDGESVFCMNLWAGCSWGNFTDLRLKGWEVDSPDPTNPLFVDVANHDFHLLPGSPAISAGIAIPNITTDRDGISYGAPPSIGAFEYVP